MRGLPQEELQRETHLRHDDDHRLEGDVDAYNAIAVKVMKENGIAIDDLAADVGPEVAKLQRRFNQLPFYKNEGYEVLGKAVVKSLNAAIAK